MKGIILPTDKYNEFFTRYIKLHQDVLNDIEYCKMELTFFLMVIIHIIKIQNWKN